MNDDSFSRFTLELPRAVLPTDAVLHSYGLAATYERGFSVLVAVLMGATPMGLRPDDADVLSLIRQLGRAFNDFGKDEQEGWKYMQAAYSAAHDLYGFDLSWLNVEWSGIGGWLA